MNISYTWLNNYIKTSLSATETAEILTSIGLEVENVTKYESIKGGLEGVIVGKVIECVKHENSDHLHITKVDLGDNQIVQIVCGAPNISKDLTVPVATIGTELFTKDGSFKIKKSKIRGEESFGMICSEVELQIGEDNSGIMILSSDIPAGTPLSDVYNIFEDYIIEIDITPNRVDATSHWGVARDLYAYLIVNDPDKIIEYNPPVLEDDFFDKYDKLSNQISVHVDNNTDVIRYSGILIDNISISESPLWLKNYLSAIGLNPINNIVDITNYILYSLGQPLHAFDANLIQDRKLIIREAQNKEKLTLLDMSEVELNNKDIVISDCEKPLCLGGVMGGNNSGVNDKTQMIFLESANFHPTRVRKTARNHGISSDSSFRFERGLDPNRTIQALHYAFENIKKVCPEAKVISPLFDYYPDVKKPFEVKLNLRTLDKVIGTSIDYSKIIKILEALEIGIVDNNEEVLDLKIPRYRVDVTREVDVIEEILRIYGYNKINSPSELHSSITYKTDTDKKISQQIIISEMLTGAGFNEILNNSLSASKFFLEHNIVDHSELVYIVNPLSSDLNILRPSMVKGGLDVIEFNEKRKAGPLCLYEFGNIYRRIRETKETQVSGFFEEKILSLWLTGDKGKDHWARGNSPYNVFHLKSHVYNILLRLGIQPYNVNFSTTTKNPLFTICEEITSKTGDLLVRWGRTRRSILKDADIDSPVFYAELYWDKLFTLSSEHNLKVTKIPKYPSVRRDFALLLDSAVPFSEIERVAYSVEKKLLKGITLFDVYEDPKHLPPGKKSYAVAFELQDPDKTLSDKTIDSIMNRIQKSLERELGASLR